MHATSPSSCHSQALPCGISCSPQGPGVGPDVPRCWAGRGHEQRPSCGQKQEGYGTHTIAHSSGLPFTDGIRGGVPEPSRTRLTRATPANNQRPKGVARARSWPALCGTSGAQDCLLHCMREGRVLQRLGLAGSHNWDVRAEKKRGSMKTRKHDPRVHGLLCFWSAGV